MTTKQMMKSLVGAGAMLALAMGAAAGSAQAAAPKAEQTYGKRASIPFANSGAIRDWHADTDRSLYLRDRTGRWYHATLSGPCPSLRFQHRIGFETGPLGTFDEWSVIRTRDHRCHIDTLVTSPAPAAKGGSKA
jgi:hypothetical protein